MTSTPTGVILLPRRQPDKPAAATNKLCSIRTRNGVYTKFGIDPSKETAAAFTSYLISEKYLLDEGLSGSDIVHGTGFIFKSSTGISDYISDRGLSASYAITDVDYSWSTITTQVTSNDAILLAGTDAESHPDYPNHWIIVYGYDTVSGDQYLLINDGWGDDEIYTTADSQYYPWGLVYIYQK